ncbi:hypothetical protein [Nocardioides sp.]|uniref:hypothetical protein n=1 Tax=Nocardioides sp. TaxID=35761 RepID=UPI003519A5F6
MLGVVAAHLVAVEPVGADRVVVGAIAPLGSVDGADRQRGLQRARLPDALLRGHQANALAGEQQVAGVVLCEGLLAGGPLLVEPGEGGVTHRELTQPLLGGHARIMTAAAPSGVRFIEPSDLLRGEMCAP